MRNFWRLFGVTVLAIVLTLSEATPLNFSGFGSKSGHVDGSANFSFEVAGSGQGQGQGSATGGSSMVKRDLNNHVHTAN
ncbi:unnamed protein product [Ceutorhynchus assimilis]|uniref:Uncharacterized protein n=1 Tax=Ceutorhynchus assimilis TaxID=467358 RepID=A0A9P0DIT1_9CUCU|nr:unnamed protein product [Ceutorhynchus assimilis]